MAEDEHAAFARGEVEEAFAHWWKVGCVDEDWAAWVNLFVPDVLYHDHFWGPLHGRDEVALWIAAVMKGVPEIYTVLDWYTIDGDTVLVEAKEVAAPTQVRFGWRNETNPNLVNKEGLPASPFQTNDWQGGTSE